MLKHHLIINWCHLIDFLLFSWHFFLCCSHSRCFGEFGSKPDFDDINTSFNFSSISPLNETLLFLNNFSIFGLVLFFCWFKNHTSFWSCWVFFPNPFVAYTSLECIYYLSIFFLSARWVIAVRCLRNTWHYPHRLSDLGMKTSQFIICIVSSSSTVLNFLFSIFALHFLFIIKVQVSSMSKFILYYLWKITVPWACMKF